MDQSLPISNLMADKKGLIMGVANASSLAWGIAQACSQAGADLCFSYQGEALHKRVKPLAQSLNCDWLIPCDVSSDDSLDACFDEINRRWGALDFVVHAIGYSDKEELKGGYVNTSRDNFANSLDISCYSFTAVSQRAARLMPNGGALLTLTYFGAVQVMPHYNVMGVAKAALEASVRYLASDLGEQKVRVNAISAGPVRTLAASGISDFRMILKWNELNAPLRRNITNEDVGKAALYLLSDLSASVTGDIHYVDSGYHSVGMLAVDNVNQVADLLQTYAQTRQHSGAD